MKAIRRKIEKYRILWSKCLKRNCQLSDSLLLKNKTITLVFSFEPILKINEFLQNIIERVLG